MKQLIIPIILTSCLQSSCAGEQKIESEHQIVSVMEELNFVKVIPGTLKMDICPRDMFKSDANIERACIIFPNDEASGNNRDYTPDYLKQLEGSIWSKPNKIGNLIFFNDTTDERGIQEKSKCPKILSLAIWYDGEAASVDSAIKTETTNQFENKILAFSLIGNDCN